MRTAALLFLLATVVSSVPQNQGANVDVNNFLAQTNLFAPNAGGDTDVNNNFNAQVSVTDLLSTSISEAEKFLSDQQDSSFNFNQWYQNELANFEADQDNVPYTSAQAKANDLQDFELSLNNIATKFGLTQGNDLAAFTRDVTGSNINELSQQSQKIIAYMRSTAQEINAIEKAEYNIYSQMKAIGCSTIAAAVPPSTIPQPTGTLIDVTPYSTGGFMQTTGGWVPVTASGLSFGDQVGMPWPGTGNPPVTITPPITPVGPLNNGNSCVLMNLWEELVEYAEYYDQGIGAATNVKYNSKINQYNYYWRQYVTKWLTLQHKFQNIQQEEQEETNEYNAYASLLASANTLANDEMMDADSVDPDSLIPTTTAFFSGPSSSI
jgi:hypothetical protein